MAQTVPDLNINGVTYNISQLWYSGTYINVTSCTPETCSLLLGTYTYLPNLPGNIFFAIIFGLLFAINLPLGIYYRTWGYMVGMLFGIGLEVAAYVTRILIHYNDFDRNLYITHLYCVSLGPAFLSASIYLCLARIFVACGEKSSRWKPGTYSVAFVTGDVLALCLQGAGGGMAVVPEVADIGVHVMVAGLSFQVLSLTVFALACADFAWRTLHYARDRDSSFESLLGSKKWIWFLMALGLATALIYIRSVYRIAELQAGFHSYLVNQETLFMLLEGTMIRIACIALTVFHPGIIFRGHWRHANFSFRSSKREQEELALGTIPRIKVEE